MPVFQAAYAVGTLAHAATIALAQMPLTRYHLHVDDREEWVMFTDLVRIDG